MGENGKFGKKVGKVNPSGTVYLATEKTGIYEGVEYKPGWLGKIGEKYTYRGKEISRAKADNIIRKLPPQQRELAQNDLREQVITKLPARAVESMITAAEVPARMALGGSITGPLATLGFEGIRGSAREALKGGDIKSITSEGAKRGVTAGAIDLATLAAFRVGEAGMNKLARSGLALDKNTYNYISKNPRVMLDPQRPVVNIADDAVNAAKEYAKKSKVAYKKGLDALNVKPGKIIKVPNIKNVFKEFGVGKEGYKKMLLRARGTQLSDLSDDAVERYVNGRAITFKEARSINSLLADITESGATDAIGGGAINKLSGFKKALLSSMDDQVKGIRDVNKAYAKSIDLYGKSMKVVRDTSGKIKEGPLKKVGEELLGKVKNRTIDAETLRELQSKVPEISFLDPLRASVARETVDKASGVGRRVAAGLGVGAIGGLAGRGRDEEGKSTFDIAKPLAGAAVGSTITNPAFYKTIVPHSMLAGRALGPYIKGGAGLGLVSKTLKSSDEFIKEVYEERLKRKK